MRVAVIGQGPAGLALAHRAAARGLYVEAWDPQPYALHVLSVFTDELPAWAKNLPARSTTTPVVYTHGGRKIRIDREYRVLDNARVWQKLTTFPVHRELVDADTVTPAELGADVIVDARGTRDLYTPGSPVQVATDDFVAAQQQAHESVFMDFRDVPSNRFTYQIPLDSRRMLRQDTVLATRTPPEEADVFIPLLASPYAGSHIPYGARAGFVNPFTGYSVATSFCLADETADAISARLLHGTGGSSPRLPWEKPSFRTDRYLSVLCLRTLLSVPSPLYRTMIEGVFSLRPELARKLLILGYPGATLEGMARIWATLAGSDKVRLARAFAGAATSGLHLDRKGYP
ncbi:lycopene cyclase family protein [Corynebacterium pyruviciproducens]|uniref:Lycopene cyclase family protein n=1 Tax=Corynebacterium pyruviciproducens TaxID=598660 RepID=A0AAF0YSD1_9CORY|nr:lycopene cyclase family protein [Corynebacterium pyruviciproducens]WOT03282.1 lycopene cyclase family protein [Corynebacterium pyruviciproducens]